MESIFDSLLQEYTEARSKFKEALTEQFGVKIGEIISTSSLIGSITFDAYAPFWNDGDACEFSINVENMEMFNAAGNPIAEKYYMIRYWHTTYDENGVYVNGDYIYSEHLDKPTVSARAAVIELVNSIDVDLLKEVFEGDFKITIYRDGKSEVESFEDHD